MHEMLCLTKWLSIWSSLGGDVPNIPHLGDVKAFTTTQNSKRTRNTMATTLDTKEVISRLAELIATDSLNGSESKLLASALDSFDDDAKVWLHQRIEWPDGI